MSRTVYALTGAGCLLAATIACSNAANPISPNAAVPGSGAAGPNGETLKIAAPAATAPAGGAVASFPVTLTVANVIGTYATFPVTYRYEIRNAAGTAVATGTQAASSGSATSIVVSQTLAFDAAHTWRVRAEYNGAFGPWSAAASFRSPAGSFMRGREALDLLTDGKTVGQMVGDVTLTSDGARIGSGDSYIAYPLPETLGDGEFSFIAQGIDEGNPGDKAKVASMGEGCHVDVTDNDYRVSLEVRGSDHPIPGIVSYRMITGDATDEHSIHDTNRHLHIPGWTRAQTYFVRLFWRTGIGGYEVREGGPTGPVHDADSVTTDGHPYRPTPHCLYVGSPPSRGGVANQTHPNMTVRNVWISQSARPTFPTIIGRPE
jgi:hypothetical protein